MGNKKANKFSVNYIKSHPTYDFNYFTSLTINKNELVLPDLLNCYSIKNIKHSLKIISASLIDTIKGTSIEGQHLTGKALSLIGSMNLKILFFNQKCNPPFYISDISIPFSTYIILPKEIDSLEKFDLTYYFEDISILPIVPNKLFISARVLLIYND